MLAEQLTKEIYDKCPKVYFAIKEKYNYTNMHINNDSLSYIVNYSGIGIKRKGKELATIMPFSLLYSLLEDFFEDNGIHVWVESGYGWKAWIHKEEYGSGKIFNYTEFVDIHHEDCEFYASKNEAKYAAILKASEIMEGRL